MTNSTKLTNEQIILNAIIQAEENGFKSFWREQLLDVKLQASPDQFQEYAKEIARTIVYDHKFAKALFGDTFKLNLRECVMEENPITYLREWFSKPKKK